MSNILCSIPIKDIKGSEYLSVHEAKQENAIATNVQPPALYLPCEHEGDTPYFWAYECIIYNKHYIYIGSFVGTDDFQYYCPEDDKYERFSRGQVCRFGKRYYKFVIYKYFE